MGGLGGKISLCPIPLVDVGCVLLQLLSGKVLLQVALIARQRQAVCDAGQEGHWSTVLLQLSGLLLHMHWVAARQSRWTLACLRSRAAK